MILRPLVQSVFDFLNKSAFFSYYFGVYIYYRVLFIHTLDLFSIFGELHARAKRPRVGGAL